MPVRECRGGGSDSSWGGVAKFAPAPKLTVALPSGATVAPLYELLANRTPELAERLPQAAGSLMAVLADAYVARQLRQRTTRIDPP
jgi:hypothetical protein